MSKLVCGDRIYYKNFQEFGILTKIISEYSLLILLDDDADTNQELEVQSNNLIQIRSHEHETMIKETYEL